jgi:hypothetical protein
MAIIDFPDTGLIPGTSFGEASFQIGFMDNRRTFTSPLTGSVQTVGAAGGRWKCTIGWDILRNLIEAPAVEALMMSLSEGNRLRLWDLRRRTPTGVGGGAPAVDGAGQVGRALNIKGAPLSTTAWLRAGDWVHIAGIGAYGQLCMVTADVNTTAAGLAVLPLAPAMRGIPANNAVITLTKASALFIPPAELDLGARTGARRAPMQLDLVEVFE